MCSTNGCNDKMEHSRHLCKKTMDFAPWTLNLLSFTGQHLIDNSNQTDSLVDNLLRSIKLLCVEIDSIQVRLARSNKSPQWIRCVITARVISITNILRRTLFQIIRGFIPLDGNGGSTNYSDKTALVIIFKTTVIISIIYLQRNYLMKVPVIDTMISLFFSCDICKHAIDWYV